MQANVLTLAVDLLNTGTTTPEVYERFEEFQNRSTYIGAGHSLEARDTVNLYRTFPTKSGNFKGVAKTSVKFTKDFAVPAVDGVATLASPLIIEVSFSIPVGVAPASIRAARQRAISLLDSDVTMDALNIQLMV